MDEVNTARHAVETAPQPGPAAVSPFPPATDMVAPLPIVASVLAAASEPVLSLTSPVVVEPRPRRRRRHRLLSVAIVAGALSAVSLWHQGRRPPGYVAVQPPAEPPAAMAPTIRVVDPVVRAPVQVLNPRAARVRLDRRLARWR